MGSAPSGARSSRSRAGDDHAEGTRRGIRSERGDEPPPRTALRRAVLRRRGPTRDRPGRPAPRSALLGAGRPVPGDRHVRTALARTGSPSPRVDQDGRTSAGSPHLAGTGRWACLGELVEMSIARPPPARSGSADGEASVRPDGDLGEPPCPPAPAGDQHQAGQERRHRERVAQHAGRDGRAGARRGAGRSCRSRRCGGIPGGRRAGKSLSGFGNGTGSRVDREPRRARRPGTRCSRRRGATGNRIACEPTVECG
jgi:hypothetical protein